MAALRWSDYFDNDREAGNTHKSMWAGPVKQSWKVDPDPITKSDGEWREATNTHTGRTGWVSDDGVVRMAPRKGAEALGRVS